MNNNNTNANFNINAGNQINEDALKEKYIRRNNAKLQTAKIATALMIIAALLFSMVFYGYGATDNTAARKWVYDKDGILNDATINAINNKNADLFENTGYEIVVVAEKESGANINLIQRAEKLFENYKVSDKGVLFIVSVPSASESPGGVVGEFVESIKEAVDGFVGTRYTCAYKIGRNVDYSVEENIDRIIKNNFTPLYNSGDYNAAVLNAFNALAGYFESGSGYTKQSESNGSVTTYVTPVPPVPPVPVAPSVSAAMRTGGISTIFIVFIVLITAIVIINSINKKNRKTYRGNNYFWGPGADKLNNSRKSNNWKNFF